MKTAFIISFSLIGWLGLAIFIIRDHQPPEPCECAIPLEYCKQKLKEMDQYSARYFTIGECK